MNEDKSLLLFVDVKEIFNQKIKLENTKSYDSIEKKKEQVLDNLIKNANHIYDTIIDNQIDDQIKTRIPDINCIDSGVYNENEIVPCKTILKRKTLEDFNRYLISEFKDNVFANMELEKILNNFTDNYFHKQQTTTISIIFKGRKPKLFVLKRLQRIAMVLDSEPSVMFKQTRLKQIINIILEDPDIRTANDYLKCLIDYSKNNSNIITFYDIIHNMRGFSKAVSNMLEENEGKHD